MNPIPQCQYVIRKGEEPLPGRANILPWSPALALRPDEWEPFLGPMPPLPKAVAEKDARKPALTPEQANEALRRLSIVNALDHLESDEFTAQGAPKLEALKALTGFTVSAAERDEAWARHKAKAK